MAELRSKLLSEGPVCLTLHYCLLSWQMPLKCAGESMAVQLNIKTNILILAEYFYTFGGEGVKNVQYFFCGTSPFAKPTK